MTLWILLIVHFIADFTLQSAEWANKKTQKLRFLFGHALIYAAVMAVAVFVTIPANKGWLPFVIIAVSHLAIDWIRVASDKKSKKPVTFFCSFVIDQILHIAIIVILVKVFSLNTQYTTWFSDWSTKVPLDDYLRYLLLFVIIWDPASVFVKKLSLYVSGKVNTAANNEEAPVGSIIGKMERLIITMLVLCNQIGAIGFVLTAKSLARYKQLSEKDFAEKYLVGTLTSTAIAIVAALLLK